MTGSEITTIKGIDCYEENGVVYLKLEPCAKGLGFVDSSKEIEYVKWDRVRKYLDDFGFSTLVSKDSFIPENIFYRLAMKARNETAEKFQAFVADEVIPSIRRTGFYSKKLSHTELIFEQAKALMEQEKEMAEQKQRLAAVESDVHVLKAKVETSTEDTFTVAGYASLKGLRLSLNKANALGRRAAKLSRELGYEISKTHDPRFGLVNVYHVDILKEVFKEAFAW